VGRDNFTFEVIEMTTRVRSIFPFLLTSLLAFTLFAPISPAAQDHVVSLADLHQAVNSAAQQRQANISQVKNFFSSKPVEKTLKSAHLDAVQIQKAIPTLSDQELAQLSSQTKKVQSDFAAGSLTNQQLTYIIIALGTAVLLLIIFVAK
jgi:hypothetical protein